MKSMTKEEMLGSLKPSSSTKSSKESAEKNKTVSMKSTTKEEMLGSLKPTKSSKESAEKDKMIGKKISTSKGEYIIKKILGSGSYGTVFRAKKIFRDRCGNKND